MLHILFKHNNKQHNCASASITVVGLIVVFLCFIALKIATRIQSIPSRFDLAVGCCVVLHPQATGRQSIPLNIIMFAPLISSSFFSSIAPMQLSPTLCIRNQVDCCVIDVCSSSGCKQSDGRTDEREYYHFYCFEHILQYVNTDLQ